MKSSTLSTILKIAAAADSHLISSVTLGIAQAPSKNFARKGPFDNFSAKSFKWSGIRKAATVKNHCVPSLHSDCSGDPVRKASNNNADEAFFASFIILRIGALWSRLVLIRGRCYFALLVRQAPISQLLMAADSSGITLSSSREVLAFVPESDRNQPRLNLDLDDLPTKRTFPVSTLYDPLEFLSPIFLSAKRILQELWLVGVDWDQPIPDTIMQQLNRWPTSLNTLKDFKSRVAPLRPLTVPKLERSLNLHFVSQSTKSSIENSRPIEWRHVPGVKNPTDECSRGLFPAEIMESDRWLTGPAFLKQEENNWPQPITLTEPNEDDPEVSANKWVGGLYGPLMKTGSALCWINPLTMLKSAEQRNGSSLNVKAIQQASKRYIRSAELECYPNEMTALEQNRLLKSSSPLLKLSPQIENVVLNKAFIRHSQDLSMPF
uniref:Uncharacterized protein n=1 Tax=Daphnia galeata TaxID=27404 RepID=A0A8J2RG36_9CRUS|nr:unnamed protein product [Daphnia galeata]